MFINQTDLYSIVRADVMDEITGSDAALFNEAAATAVAEATDYLNNRYDTVQIFNKTGDARHPSIIRVVAQIALYHIHKRLSPHSIPELRRIDYEDAIKWLKDVRDGKTAPKDLPRIEDEDGNIETGSRFGSDTRLTEPW